MQTKRNFASIYATSAASLAILLLGACQTSQAPTPAPESKAAPAVQVHVIFEGPWAIVPDPKDANSILAVAPRTKSHRPLGLEPANTTLEPGVYDLQVPAHASTSPTFDKNILRVNTDPQMVQRALDKRLERYAIRLPKPEAYVAETRYVSRAGPTYPPDPSTEMPYVTAISLRYSVSSTTGFSLTGTKDAGGAFNPQLLPLDTPIIRFEIDPAEDTDNDPCYTHARQAFHDVVGLIGVKFYIDFPGSPEGCHKKDPQLAQKAQAAIPGTWTAVPDANGVSLQEANVVGPFANYLDLADLRLAYRLRPAAYFFHTGGGGCIIPIPVGGG